MAEDAMDKVAQQAQMISMACGPQGMVVAAALSVADAIYDLIRDASNSNETLSSWSQMQAFQDLADDVQRDLLISKTQNLGGTVSGTIQSTKTINRDIENMEQGLMSMSEHDIQNWEDTVATGPITGNNGFGWWDHNTSTGTQTQVQFLRGYLSARVAYHGFCTATLKLRALSLGRGEDIAYMYLGNQVRQILVQSMIDTIDYADESVKKLCESIDPDVARNEVGKTFPGITTANAPGMFYGIFSNQVRSQRGEAFTNSVHYADDHKVGYFEASIAADIKDFHDILEQTKSQLKTFQSKTPVPIGPLPGSSQGSNSPQTQQFGARKPNTLRVLFEYPTSSGASDGTAVPGPVLGDGPDATQNVAVEVVGHNESATPFQLGTTGLAPNSASEVLRKAGTLGQVNTELVNAFNQIYGTGTYGTHTGWDGKTPFPAVSLAAPLVSGTGSIGAKTLALLFVRMDQAFFKLPAVAAPGAVAKAARSTYDSMFQQIADWNATKPVPISAVRLSLVSEQDLLGDMPSAYISADLVGVVLDAAIAAMVASPQHLADLTLLVPINAAKGGWLRKTACDNVARTRKATVFTEGFDLPIS